MSRLSSISNRTSTGNNGGALPPRTGGGGGGRGRGSGDTPNYGERLRRARLGLAVAIIPIFMLFISFTVAYLVWRGLLTVDVSGAHYARQWSPVSLPWSLIFVNTAILVGSTATAEFARRDITRQAALAPIKSIPGVSLGKESRIPWLAITTICGLAFLAGQLIVWKKLSGEGVHFAGGPGSSSSSFIYFLTGMHGLHLAGGACALLISNGAALLHRPVENRRILVDVTAWYWHLMTGLWIYILVLFAFAVR